MAVFVTGATGFLGTEVVSSLLRSTDEIIYVLVRAEDEEAATHRLKSFWYEKKTSTPESAAGSIRSPVTSHSRIWASPCPAHSSSPCPP